MSVREPNRMSVEEARALSELSNIDWRAWEEKFNGVLREYGWRWWQDRVVPAQPIRRLLYAHRVPKPVVEQIVGMVQRMGRRKGFPDRLIAKEFGSWAEVPEELRKLIGEGPLQWATPPFVLVGFVELKSGSATTTEGQDEWLRVGRACPGMFALEARPEQLPYLRKVLSG